MSSIKVDCNNGSEILEALHNFLIIGKYSQIDYSNCTGSVIIDDCIGTSASINEKFVATFTSPTAFSVSAQYSGVLGSGSIGTKFNNSKIAFTITSATSADNIGSLPCVIGDKIVILMTSPWKSVTRSAGSNYTWCAPGNDDLRKIYVGMTTFTNASGGFFNARVKGYPLYNESLNTSYKPCDSKVWALGPDTGQACTLFAKADGRFCYAICKVGTIYSACCFGFVDMINTYEEHFCPMLLGGGFTMTSNSQELTSTGWKWTSSSLRSPMLGLDNTAGDKGAIQRESTYNDYNLNFFSKQNMWGGVGRLSSTVSYAYYDWVIDAYNYKTPFLVSNFDGSRPLFPFTITRYNWSIDSQTEVGYVVPFVKYSANMDLNNNVVVPETITRDTKTREKYMFVSNGYVVDQYNFYCIRTN
jgi:hypothetical protein